MKLVLISDTHTYHRSLNLLTKDGKPLGDVLVHCGDLTNGGEMETVHDYCLWVKQLGYQHNIFIPGNHDFCFDIRFPDRYVREAREAIETAGMYWLHERTLTIDGVRFYGSSWCPNLDRWAFWDKNRNQYADAPQDVDVLVTHSPAFGVLDDCGPHVGSEHLARFIRHTPILLHAHGHIHESHGTDGPYGENPLSYTVVNSAICSREYRPINKAFLATLDMENYTVDVEMVDNDNT